MKSPPVIIKSGVITLLLLSSGGIGYFLSLGLYAQIIELRADQLIEKGHDVEAIQKLQKAIQLHTFDFQRKKKIAGVYKRLALSKSDAKLTKQLLEKSKDSYLAAMHLNPVDTDIFFNLALVEIESAKANTRLGLSRNPTNHKIRSYFDRSIHLNPNQTYHRYAYARYLHRNHKILAFLREISTMAQINPIVYHTLKNESFWSYLVQEATIDGLNEAIKLNITPLEAYRALAELYDKDQQWDHAIHSYEKIIALSPSSGKRRVNDYIHMGRLNLLKGYPQLAAQKFIVALDLSTKPNDTLEEIYKTYKQVNYQDQWEIFHPHLKGRYFDPAQIELIHARSFFDCKDYGKAKQLFKKIITVRPVSQAYYYLAQIAEIEQDFNAMEQSGQKAVTLDPNNLTYIQILHRVYWRLEKFDLLEDTLTQAIQRLRPKSVWLYQERARLRLRRNDFINAIKDWQSAIRLSPKRDDFYARIAETYLKAGNASKALTYYQEAAKINPRNKTYYEQIKAIKTDASKV